MTTRIVLNTIMADELLGNGFLKTIRTYCSSKKEIATDAVFAQYLENYSQDRAKISSDSYRTPMGFTLLPLAHMQDMRLHKRY